MALCSRLPEVLATHANVLHSVLGHLPPVGASRLRNVNRVLRAAVNRRVSVVACALGAPHFCSELADVFPEADRLRVDLNLERSALTAKQDTAVFLDYILAVSPVLATKICALELFMNAVSTFDSINDAVTTFVTKCTSLQEMKLHFQPTDSSLHEHFKLQGQGRTAEERLGSMQQQLAALQGSSSFLAPTSWASTRCLTSLRLDMGSPRHDASYLEAAMQAPSLVELHVRMPTAEAATSASSLPSVSGLSSLTSLAIDSVGVVAGTTPHQRPILDAIAHMSSLQSLTTDDWLLGTFQDEERAGVPHSWSRLTALTALTVMYADLHLSECAGLLSLRDLNLRDTNEALGSIASLLPLTGLTSLIGPDDDESSSLGEEEAMVVVPQQWKAGLRTLHWPTGSGATLAVVSQLTALTWLSLNDVSPSFEACRALGQLRSLQQLSMGIHSSGQDTHCSPSAGVYRPAWPSLTEVALRMPLDNMGLCPLHALARWTDIPPTCTLRFLTDPATRILAVKGWGAGWLHAAFTNQHMRSLQVMLVDDCDVAAYIDALGSLDITQLRFHHRLAVGEAVTPAGFHRLASAPKLPSGLLGIDGALTPEPYMIGWRDKAVLRSQHFKALSTGSSAPLLLKQLVVVDGSLLTDRDVAMLASAAPGLKQLAIRRATRLTDAALYALLGCQQLEVLQVMHAQLTSSGVLVVLALLKALGELVIGNQASTAAGAMVAEVRRVDPAVAEQWSAVEKPHFITWTRRNV